MIISPTKNKNTHSEQDTAWKEILDFYFKDCLDYCLPHLSQLIDWAKPRISLDKELQTITKTTETGKRILDKLYKVYLNDGREQWILIHVEIQGKPDVHFPKRMFTYAYRLYDKYQQPIVSCAILTDNQRNWRPNSFEINVAGSYLRSGFLVIKLLDYYNKLDELENSLNPFANVILVQLRALEAKSKPDIQRKQIKFALTKRLYEKGFNKIEIVNFYQFIDWLIGLPAPLELEYLNEISMFEESKKMAYVTSFERYGKELWLKKGIEEGMEKGIEQGIEQGAEQRAKSIAIRMLSAGLELDLIAKLTQLPINEIEKLK